MTENFLALPQNLEKTRLYIADPRDYKDSIAMSYFLARGGLTINLPSGDFTYGSQERRNKLLLSYRNIFHFSPPNQIYALFDKASDRELTEFAIMGETNICGCHVKEYSGNLILKQGNKTTQIINIASFLKNRIERDQDSVQRALNELLSFNRELSYPTTLITPAANAKDCALLDENIFEEIREIGFMPNYILDKFMAACIGGIMESTGVGTKYMVGYDMVQCHLNILMDYPSAIDSILIRDSGYDERDLPISIYKIKVTIPDDFCQRTGISFLPIPQKTEAGIKKVTGTWVAWYFKDYLDLIVYLNKEFNAGIEFKVVESYVLINNNPSYPFREYMKELRGANIAAKVFYPNIEPKPKYNTLAGSSKSIRRVVDPKTLGEKQVPSIFFAPIIYGFVLSRQNCSNYLRGVNHNAIALKMDATEEPSITEEGDLFIFKGDGAGTFLNQYLKSTASNQKKLWRDAIEASEGNPFITILQDFYPSIKAYMNPFLPLTKKQPLLKLGKRYTRERQIKPSYGVGRSGPEILDVAELLDNWHESCYNEASDERVQYDLMRIERFRELFPRD